MGFPVGFEYTDLNVRWLRLSGPLSFGISSVAYPSPTPDTWTINGAYDSSSAALSCPLSGGRVVTFYYAERIDGVTTGSVGSGALDIYYTVEAVITQGLSILGRYTLQFPGSPLSGDTSNTYGNQETAPSYAFQVAEAGDRVLFGSCLFDLAPDTSYDPRYYGAQWLVLFDCSGSVPTVTDTYLREDTNPPFTGYPPEADVMIALRPLDDTHVLAFMLNPDSTADPGEGSLFAIDVSGGNISFLDNGYPSTTGATDFRYAYDIMMGYNDNVGMFTSADEYAFGLSVSLINGNINFGSTVPSWDFEGYTYYMWGISGDLVPSAEPGVFYGPVYRLPDIYSPFNPMHTAKFQYTGSGAVQLVDVSPALPSPEFSWGYTWAHSPGSGWRCVEHNGKVVTALPGTSHFDGVDIYEDLWLVDDTFGTPKVYRVANLSNIGGLSANADFDVTLISSGGYLYVAANIVDAYNSDVLTPADTYESASAIVMTIVNFAQPDIAGELSEQRRKFWRPRPGW